MRTERHSKSLKNGVKWRKQKPHQDELFMNPQTILWQTVKIISETGFSHRKPYKSMQKWRKNGVEKTTPNEKPLQIKDFFKEIHTYEIRYRRTSERR